MMFSSMKTPILTRRRAAGATSTLVVLPLATDPASRGTTDRKSRLPLLDAEAVGSQRGNHGCFFGRVVALPRRNFVHWAFHVDLLARQRTEVGRALLQQRRFSARLELLLSLSIALSSGIVVKMAI